jgi:hypothetical protein
MAALARREGPGPGKKRAPVLAPEVLPQPIKIFSKCNNSTNFKRQLNNFQGHSEVLRKVSLI